MCCSIPVESRGGFSQCRMYRRNYSRVAEAVELALGQELPAVEAALAALVPSPGLGAGLGLGPGGLWGDGNESVLVVAQGEDTLPCAHGYAFDYSQYATTVVTEVSEAVLLDLRRHLRWNPKGRRSMCGLLEAGLSSK